MFAYSLTLFGNERVFTEPRDVCLYDAELYTIQHQLQSNTISPAYTHIYAFGLFSFVLLLLFVELNNQNNYAFSVSQLF